MYGLAWVRASKTSAELLIKLHDKAGQTMAEYAVVSGVITIAVAVTVTLGLLNTAIQGTLSNVIFSL